MGFTIFCGRFILLNIFLLGLLNGANTQAAVSTIPSSPYVTVGETLAITLATPVRVKDCTIAPVTAGITGATTDGKCVVTVDATATAKAQIVTLKVTANAETGTGTDAYTSDLSITIYDNIKSDTTVYVEVHDFAHTTLNVHDEKAPIQYCYYETINGAYTDMKPTCEYEMSPATKSHEGIWYVNTGYVGTTSEIRQEINITVTDTIGSVGTWTLDKTAKKVVLTCNVGKPITMCRFTKNTTIISLSEGLGNSKYQYIGQSFEHGDCGMTILTYEKEEDVIGLWKCYWTEKEGTFNRYLLLDSESTEGNYVKNVAQSAELTIESKSPIYALTGMENVELECSVEGAVLNYCWFTSPDGTHHIPKNINELELRHGICKYNITVSGNDAGDWTCQLGVFARGLEMTKTINLKIMESLIQATYSGVEVKGNSATVSCEIIDTFKELRYCRYVRPDGIGITVPFGGSAYGGKYKSLDSEKKGKCELSITGVGNEDIGVWTCAGRLFESSIDREHSATVYIYNPGLSGGQIAGIVIGVLLIIAAIGGVLFYFLKVRRGR